MLLVTEEMVGDSGFRRAVRSGELMPLLPGIAVPPDIDITADLRTYALVSVLPVDTRPGGLTGVWAMRGGPLPPILDAVGAPGPRRRRARPVMAMRSHVHDGEPPPPLELGRLWQAPTEIVVAESLLWGPSAAAVRPLMELVAELTLPGTDSDRWSRFDGGVRTTVIERSVYRRTRTAALSLWDEVIAAVRWRHGHIGQ